MKQRIWSTEARLLLYRLITERFGKFETWHGGMPSNQQAFRKFLETFAKTVGANSGDAVMQQVRFALPETQSGSTWDRPQAETAMRNKIAALDAGFIRPKHLPQLMAVGPKQPKQPKPPASRVVSAGLPKNHASVGEVGNG